MLKKKTLILLAFIIFALISTNVYAADKENEETEEFKTTTASEPQEPKSNTEQNELTAMPNINQKKAFTVKATASNGYTYTELSDGTIDKLLRNMNDDYCFFLKMLNNVEVKDFSNIINEHSFYLDNISILELISKFYPDVNIKNVSKDFISYVRQVIESLLETTIVEKNSELVLKEAV